MGESHYFNGFPLPAMMFGDRDAVLLPVSYGCRGIECCVGYYLYLRIGGLLQFAELRRMCVDA